MHCYEDGETEEYEYDRAAMANVIYDLNSQIQIHDNEPQINDQNLYEGGNGQTIVEEASDVSGGNKS